MKDDIIAKKEVIVVTIVNEEDAGILPVAKQSEGKWQRKELARENGADSVRALVLDCHERAARARKLAVNYASRNIDNKVARYFATTRTIRLTQHAFW